MDISKKTQMWIGVVTLAGVAVWLLNKNKSKDKVFANFAKEGKAAPGCKFYPGSCGHPVGTRITNWVDGNGAGIIVSSSSSQCLVCPVSPNTPTGMPSL